MESVDCVVVGAGVIGLGVARALAMAGREVVVLERNAHVGEETSSRSSEVIHGGMYYATGSLKARLCVAGRRALYAFCDSHGVPYRRSGKLIVAVEPAQRPALEAILAQGRTNGIDDLRLLDKSEVAALEPAVRADCAILSPSTGIVDSHAFMVALRGDAEALGAVVALQTPVERGEIRPDGFLIETGGAEPMRLLARTLVNAAGLGAWEVARKLDGYPEALVPPRVLSRGVYFVLAGRTPFTHLIYPIPEGGGLGVHVTLDRGGQARFGPDVEWVTERRYEVDPRRADKFYAAIRAYWPGLPDGALQPAYSGIRPKIGGPNDPAPDFLIHGPAETGLPGYAALYGIESPGLTASLAIADAVADKLGVETPT